MSGMDESIYTPKLHDVSMFKSNEIFIIFLVMEYVPCDLFTLDFALLSSHELKTLIYRILCAVNYIHSANIMHRDLKP